MNIRRHAICIALIAVLSGCASQDQMRTAQVRIEDISSDIQTYELRRQELAATLARLKLQGAQQGQEYRQASESLKQVENSLKLSLDRISALESQGKITANQVSAIHERLSNLRQRQADVLRGHNEKWHRIEGK